MRNVICLANTKGIDLDLATLAIRIFSPAMNDHQILSEIKEAIYQNDPLAEAYLFGSRATNSHQEDSDWDVLILVDDDSVTHEVEDKFRDKLYDIELASEQVISIMIYPKNYWHTSLKFSPMYTSVQRDGRRLR